MYSVVANNGTELEKARAERIRLQAVAATHPQSPWDAYQLRRAIEREQALELDTIEKK